MAILPGLYGLYVHCGRYSPADGRWAREPYAEFTCSRGCARYAAGADQVTALCRGIWAWHADNCPRMTGHPRDHE